MRIETFYFKTENTEDPVLVITKNKPDWETFYVEREIPVFKNKFVVYRIEINDWFEMSDEYDPTFILEYLQEFDDLASAQEYRKNYNDITWFYSSDDHLIFTLIISPTHTETKYFIP